MYAATGETFALGRCFLKRHDAPASAHRTDDTALVQRIQAGEQAAFQELVERYQSRVFRVIYGILRNRADAEEIAQEVFAKVYFSIQTFDCRSALYTWIYRIAVNECYAWLRKRRVPLVYEGDRTPNGNVLDLQATADARSTADRALADRDFVNKLLSHLPEDERALLLWKEVEGFSVLQLAEMTGLNESTVKVRLFRARQKLAERAARLSRPRGRRGNSR